MLINILKVHGNRLQQQQLLRLAWRAIARDLQSVQGETNNSKYLKSITDEWKHAKPFRKIPGPTKYQLVRGYMKGGEFENINFIGLLLKCRQKYGDIFLLPGIGKEPILSIFDPVDFERVNRTEGKYPERPGSEAVVFYRESRKDGFFKNNLGVVGSDKDWGDFRTRVNPVLMKPQNARLYLDSMASVSDEFIQHIRDIRDPLTQEVPENFATDINHLTFESLAVVALNKRLGFIRNNQTHEDAKKLFECLTIFIESIYDLSIKPGFYRYFPTPTYRRFEKAMDYLYVICKKYIDEAIERIEGGNAGSNSVLEQLLSIDRKVAVTLAIDLLQGGVETTSSILVGAMLLLATHPEKQSKLRTEIIQALGQDRNARFTYANMQHLPYLRACIKEAMRIYPLVSGNFRSTGMDIVLGGYRVPKGTRVVMNSNLLLTEEKYFPRASEFIPERWLRGPLSKDLMADSFSSFIFLPFGFGPRTCVGKRIADLELELTLANVIRNFKMEFNYSRENAFKCKFISTPAIPLKFSFIDL